MMRGAASTSGHFHASTTRPRFARPAEQMRPCAIWRAPHRWGSTSGGSPKMAEKKGFKALSTFAPRNLPQAVTVAGENELETITILGPFCETCGFPESEHITDKVRGGKNKGLVITACPPPNGLNPMERRCVPCTLRAMGLALHGQVRHNRDGLFHEEAPHG